MQKSEQRSSLKEELRLTNKRLFALTQHIYEKEGSSYGLFFLRWHSYIQGSNINKDQYKSIFDDKTLAYFKKLHWDIIF